MEQISTIYKISTYKGRFYLLSIRQMCHFPIARARAELMLATGAAQLVEHRPWSR